MRVIAAALLALSFASATALAAADGANAVDAARLARAAARCAKLAELIACDEALNMRPNDPDLLVEEADALIRTKRPGEAIGVYRNALRVGARPAAVNPKIVAAQSQRQALLDTCVTQEGEAAEHACESAWLPGAADEVTVFKRRGSLLQGETRLSASLDAYMAAARLQPRDRAVARAIVSLGRATGRQDAAALIALGTALTTLGRPSEAIASLREAVRLSPDPTLAKERLRVAERALADARSAAPAAAPLEAAADAGDASIGPYTNEAEETRSN